MKYYKVIAIETHAGAKNKDNKSEQIMYIPARDILDILNIYKKLKGVQRNDFPLSITPASKEEVRKIEYARIQVEQNTELRFIADDLVGYYGNLTRF